MGWFLLGDFFFSPSFYFFLSLVVKFISRYRVFVSAGINYFWDFCKFREIVSHQKSKKVVFAEIHHFHVRSRFESEFDLEFD